MNSRTSRAQRGVTLIELMMVVTILAIIAGIAVPSYRKYLLRSQRSEAKIALLQLQTAEEKYYLQNNSYTENVKAASPDGLGLAGVSETGKYDITVVVAADENGTEAQTFVATASARDGGGQADDTDCGSFNINERGTRTVTGGYTPEQCWK
jgi:type IV pilus assembly protein PilE